MKLAHPLLTLFHYRLLALKNTLRAARGESRLKIAVVGGVGLLFWGGLFWAFLDSFAFLQKTAGPFFKPLLHHALSIFFMALAIMLVFSNALISFSNLFKSNETAFLFSTPLRRETIFLYKLTESIIFSSWAVFALGLPLLIALGIQTRAEWPYYPLALLMLLPFVVLPAGLGALAGLLLTAFLPRYKGRALALILILLLAAGVYLSVTIFSVKGERNVDAVVNSVLGRLSFSQHYMTPNFWMTEGILRMRDGRAEGLFACAIALGAVVSSALFAAALGWFLAGSLYARAYSSAASMGQRARRQSRSMLETLLAPLIRINPQSGALLLKDIKTFFRDPAQWAQVLIFFGLLLVYSGNLRNLQAPIDQPFYRNLISFLNLGASSMTLSTLCSRFVFPMISLEGQRFWILGLAPVSRKQILWTKFYFAFGGTTLLGVPVALISNYMLESPPLVFGVQVLTSVLIAAGLSGLSVGMGALFPDFKERNPSKIVSGFGGTLTLILSVGLVAFSVGGGAVLCHRFLVLPLTLNANFAASNDWLWAGPFVGAVTLLNLLAAWIPMKLGARALERVEF